MDEAIEQGIMAWVRGEHATASRLLTGPAERGDAYAQVALGSVLRFSRPKDPIAAAAWTRRAAEQGYGGGESALAALYMTGDGVPKDTAAAADWYRRAAERGDGAAALALGTLYRHGEGVPEDAAAARSWYTRAAEGISPVPTDDAVQQEPYSLVIRRHIYVEAVIALARRYRDGQGVPQDYAEALAWYRLAADLGSPAASAGIGQMHAEGQGVPKDGSAAAQWLRKAAEQGDSQHQYRLGKLHTEGDVVPQDSAEAAIWYRKAAEQDHDQAQYELALLYHFGEGVPQDLAEAARWYGAAADHGDPKAAHNLGTLYFNGEGVPRDEGLAYEWMLIAAAVLPGRESELRPRIFEARRLLADRLPLEARGASEQRATAWVADYRRRRGRLAVCPRGID